MTGRSGARRKPGRGGRFSEEVEDEEQDGDVERDGGGECAWGDVTGWISSFGGEEGRTGVLFGGEGGGVGEG